MADPNFSWIYLIIFLAIPLSRIIPRLITRRKLQKNSFRPKTFEHGLDSFKKTQIGTKPEIETQKTLSNDKMVLRELHQGVKSFEKIQKNTGLSNNELDLVLGNLEREGLMKVVHKQGLFGLKIELHLTNKEFSE